MPFTEAQFFAVFAHYNSAIWPVPIVAVFAAIIALALGVRPSRSRTIAISWILSAMWVMNGIGYHWAYFAEVNPVAKAFGVVFVLQGIAFLIAPFFLKEWRFEARQDMSTWTALGVVSFAVIVYPVLGYLVGHRFPAVPLLGTAPCPTTIFTLGMLLLGRHGGIWLFIIPSIWAAIGTSAAFLLGVPQDLGLGLAGIVTLLALGHERLGRSMSVR